MSLEGLNPSFFAIIKSFFLLFVWKLGQTDFNCTKKNRLNCELVRFIVPWDNDDNEVADRQQIVYLTRLF